MFDYYRVTFGFLMGLQIRSHSVITSKSTKVSAHWQIKGIIDKRLIVCKLCPGPGTAHWAVRNLTGPLIDIRAGICTRGSDSIPQTERMYIGVPIEMLPTNKLAVSLSMLTIA